MEAVLTNKHTLAVSTVPEFSNSCKKNQRECVTNILYTYLHKIVNLVKAKQ